MVRGAIVRGRGGFSRGGARGGFAAPTAAQGERQPTSMSRGGVRGGSRGGRGARMANNSQSSSGSAANRIGNNFQRKTYDNNESSSFITKKQSEFFKDLQSMPMKPLDPNDLVQLKLKLVNIISASLIKEPRINQMTPTLEAIITSVYEISQYDPEFILKLGLYARDELGIRTVSNYLLCLASVIPSCQPYLKRYFNESIKIPSDWLELPNIVSKLTDSTSIPKSLRNVMVEKFPSFDAYQLGKYNTESKIKRKRKKLKKLIKKNPEEKERLEKEFKDNQTTSLKQLIRALHISKPNNHVMSILGKKYPATYEEFKKLNLPGEFEPERANKRMKLPVPETWETLLSEKGNRAATWEELIDHNKLPFMAMLRNLRNMIICGVQPTYHQWIIKKLTNEQTIAHSKQFPLRFLAAFDSIPKDIEQMKLWAAEKSIKIGYHPSKDLFEQYRDALDTSVKLATTHNVKPIRGTTYVFIYVGEGSSNTCKSNTAGKYSLLESAILLGLMCKFVSEECELVLVGSKSSSLVLHKVESVASDSILDNMQSVKSLVDTHFNVEETYKYFPTDYFVKMILDKKRVDNVVLLNHTTVSMEMDLYKRNILTKYRQEINPDLLYVNINLSGGGAVHDNNAEHPNNVHIAGFSDSILKFIAERGGADQQLQYIEKIDQIKKLPLLKQAVSSSVATTQAATSAQAAAANLKAQNQELQKILGRTQARPWKNVRIFISSTFLDMHGERDMLVKYVFPELRERCAKRKIHVTEVDLRWGITEEESLKNRSVELCLGEVDRCSPFFVGLLGQRYGWIPPHYKTSDEPKFDWLKTYPKNRSITELEMVHAMNNSQSSGKSLFYIREPSLIAEVPKEYRSQFESEDKESAHRLEQLKQQIRTNCQFYTYSANYGGLVDGRPSATNLDALHQRILEDLWHSIQAEYPADMETDESIDIMATENHEHEVYSEMKAARFVGRKDDINCLFKFADVLRPFGNSNKVSKLAVSANKSNILVVSGRAGSGKSALLANFIQQYNQHRKDNHQKFKNALPALILSHFVGATTSSTDISALIHRICYQIVHKLNINETIPTDYKQLKMYFPVLLKKASLRAKIFLFIDGIDQLAAKNSALSLDWLPLSSPVKIVLSTMEGDHTLSVLRRRKPQPLEVLLDPMDQRDSSTLVQTKLADYRKRLDDSPANNQLRTLLSKTDAVHPLYLVLACEELRVFGNFEELNEKIRQLSPTLPRLFDDILNRLETDHGKILVQNALGAIACSRVGLSEDDLITLLARKELNEQQLPIGIWSRVLRGILPFLLQNPDGTFDFFHHQMTLAVQKRYLTLSDANSRVHTMLANHYLIRADPDKSNTYQGDAKSITELPYHLAKAKNFNQLENVLCNLEFIKRKCELGLTYHLIGDYIDALGDDLQEKTVTSSLSSAKQKAKQINDNLRDFYRLISSCSHILSRSPHLIYQQAANQPSNSYPSKVARQLAAGYRQSWIEWTNKPETRDSCKQTLAGYPEGTTAVAYSPNGALMAVAARDCIIHIYNTTNMAELCTLESHTNWVSSLSFSGDSKLLVSTSWDNSVILWDVVIGAVVHRFNGHSRAVNCARFSTDSQYIATAGWDSTIIVWNVHDRSIFRTLRGHTKPVNHIAWSKEGGQLVSCSWDGTVRVWNPSDSLYNKRLLQTIDVSATVRGSLKCCEFSPNSKQIIATAMDSSVLLFDIQASKLVSIIGKHNKSVNYCSFSQDGSHFVTSSDDSTMKIWTPTLGAQLDSLKFQEGWANCLAYSPNADTMAAGCSDCVVRIYSVSPPSGKSTGIKLLREIAGHTRAILSVSFSNDGKFVASTSEDRTVRVANIDTGKLEYEIPNAHIETINSVQFSPTTPGLLITASDDFSCKVWSFGKLVATLSNNTNTVKQAVFSPNGAYIATVSRDCSITIYYTSGYKMICKMTGHTDWINFVTFSPDSKRLISGGWDFNVKIWSMNSKKELRTLKGHTGSVERGFFTPDSRYIITCSFDGTIKVWDPEVGSEITSLSHQSRISDVISNGKQSIFSCSDDGEIKCWNPIAGQCVATLTGHSSSVKQAQFMPQAETSGFGSFSSSSSSTAFKKTIASTSDDATVKIWEFSDQTSLSSAHQTSISSCAYSQDGKLLATISEDKTLKIWDVRSGVNTKTIQLAEIPTAVVFTNTGKLVVGNQTGGVVIYENISSAAAEANATVVDYVHQSQITALVALEVDDMFFSVGWDRRVYAWYKGAGATLTQVNDWIECIALSPDFVVVAGRQNSIYLIDQKMAATSKTSSFTTVLPIPFDVKYVTSLAFSPDFNTLAIGCFSGDIQLLDMKSQLFTSVFTKQTGAITGLKYIDNNHLVSASKDRSLIVWNVSKSESGFVENEFIHNSPIISMDCREHRICTGDSNGNLYFLNYHPQK
ncbi:WD40 repeat-containing protein [Heterostelium album PN500]|uniref:WD40 repeat-containing protein n=1 Tax=Heterostelium pallidum (strain ATCC 26659 / Pp 5 / PN500) TaxID=670386 RepID=D3BUH1_HETP5|nr:WD40 repeat-containing protein [Heterostelium album PN500]EFA74759.1 WD40 repeat-containing protein [Heterostelium album PN500]|eukprot:XP_020426893.1 WD40 repeat-containing protein [Heterostelium album PN500]